MKTLGALTLLALTLFGCGESTDKLACFRSVVAEAGPEADVRVMPEQWYSFLVIYPQNCEIWLYKTANATDAKVSFKARIK